MTDSRVVQLAKIILENSLKVDERLKASQLSELSLGLEGSDDVPSVDQEAQMAKHAAIGAADELVALPKGPVGSVQSLAANEYDIAALHFMHHFGVAKAFPINESASFEEVAERCKLDESQIRRILRYAMTNNIFAEPKPGRIVHTAKSRALAQNAGVILEAGQLTHQQFGAAAHMVDAIEKYGASREATQAGWSSANNASKPMFEELRDNHADRARQFGAFVDLWALQHPTLPLIGDYDWNSLSAGAHIVDVGGGEGNVSIALADAFPSFRFTDTFASDRHSPTTCATTDHSYAVQDLSDTIARAAGKGPKELSQRIVFQAHDFMADVQPVSGADVYLFRSVFHDWHDKYCVKILRNLAPALKPGARIVLNELCTDHGGLGPPIQRIVRGLDLVMMSLFNGRERDGYDFARIFHDADSRFNLWAASSHR